MIRLFSEERKTGFFIIFVTEAKKDICRVNLERFLSCFTFILIENMGFRECAYCFEFSQKWLGRGGGLTNLTLAQKVNGYDHFVCLFVCLFVFPKPKRTLGP